jgi:hypothetical protein
MHQKTKELAGGNRPQKNHMISGTKENLALSEYLIEAKVTTKPQRC